MSGRAEFRRNNIVSGMLHRTAKTPTGQRFAAVAAVAFVLLLVSARCERPGGAQIAVPAPSRHDLSADETLGGHTLARHVAKTDEELRERLRREPHISSTSTYTDRATAEAVVGAALSSGGQSFDAWRKRSGRRPNFVLHFDAGRI